ncbi:serine hydrolase [Hymenobacter sp. BT664]|uniref:Serine hydrolase n=1 Tax=Hymenobacter montanus TaxID=2771359 RepID=A0A927BFE8_9BACT|nr:serine hydrolase [Hymenobacter montanus]MBD2769896.1 serine hydrolase [Hymenobacter montanus]
MYQQSRTITKSVTSEKAFLAKTNKWFFAPALFAAVALASCSKDKDPDTIDIASVKVQDTPPQINTPVIGPDLTNYKQFPLRNLKAAPTPFVFSRNTDNQDNLLNTQIPVNGANVRVEDYLRSTATIAFLVIKNDKIIVEKYYPNEGNNYEASSVGTSFSVAKSWVSALIGIAIGEGKIKSVDEPITNYLPELRNGKGFELITIKHLLNMTSGIRFDETFNITSDLGRLYTTSDILAFVRGLDVETAPGQQLNYQSINTQLLGIILTRATQTSVTQYLQDKIWTPLGMEFDASWSLDRVGGMEKAMCCLNARARDYAKFGRLFLHRGSWQGQQIVPASWVAASSRPDPANTYPYSFLYNYQWWFPKTAADDPTTDFTADGSLGQFIYISPSKNIVIVKLSNDKATADAESQQPLREIAQRF